MMVFTYTDNPKNYAWLFPVPLAELPCKHVLRLSSDKSKKLLEESEKIGYRQAMWGYGSGIFKDEGENRIIQMQAVRKMIYKKFMRPFRVVIDKGGVPWIDNLHSAIRDILVFGDGVALSDAWFYLIDLSGKVPVVLDCRNSLRKGLLDIAGALAFAEMRDGRTNDAIRDINYTIREFLTENEISRETLKLGGAFYDAYKKAWEERDTGMDVYGAYKKQGGMHDGL